MILSQTPIEEIDTILTQMYGGAPPRVLRPTLTLEAQEDRFDDPDVVPLPPPPEAVPDALLLHQLPTDALRELFAHVALPFVLKLTCRALRDAWPERTELTLSHVCASSWRYRWAMRVGCPFVWGAPLAAKMARHGCSNALIWAVMNGMSWDKETTRQAAHHGHLDTLARALAAGCEMDGTEVARKAASHGHLDILEWIVAKYSVKWGHVHTTAAARHGHLEVLKMAALARHPVGFERGDASGGLQSRGGGRVGGAKRRAPAPKGHVRRGGARAPRDGHAAARAAGLRDDREDVRVGRLRWAAGGAAVPAQRPAPVPWDHETCEGAARNGHLRVLAWAIAQGCPTGPWVWTSPAMRGHVHVLRWLHASGWPLVDVKSVLDADPQVDVENKRTAAWLKRMRSPWQKARNVVVARSVARYWFRVRRSL